MSNKPDLVIGRKFHDVTLRYLIMSFFMIAIGILTMTYTDTILVNSFYIGIAQTVAGIMGALLCLHIVKNSIIINSFTSVTILFRIFSYLFDVAFSNYRPSLLVGALIWGLIWIGFMVSVKFISAFQTLEIERELMVARSETERLARDVASAKELLERAKSCEE